MFDAFPIAADLVFFPAHIYGQRLSLQYPRLIQQLTVHHLRCLQELHPRA